METMSQQLIDEAITFGSEVDKVKEAPDSGESSIEKRTDIKTGGAILKQEIREDQKSDQSFAAPAQPYASPMDRLAIVVQAYASDQEAGFLFGVEGVSYNLLVVAKERI